MTNDRSLYETIENLRQTKFNHIPKEIVDVILKIEEESLENRSEVLKKISKLIEENLEVKIN